MKIITGNANKNFARKISKYLGLELTKANIKRFADNEVYVEILDNVRGRDVFIIQPTSFPANDNLMELLVMIDALKRGSARRITAVIPYFGYARQDRKTSPRSPISAKLVANLLTTAGANRVLTSDLHAGQIQGFFDIPVDNLYISPVFAQNIKERYKDRNPIIVSPDIGGVFRARQLAERIEADIAIVEKRRDKPGSSKVMNVIGDVTDRECILIDDIVDSAGTLCNAADALIENGAKSVDSYCSHAVLTGSAIERIENSKMREFFITDSIDVTDKIKLSSKLRVISVSDLFAKAMSRIANEESVSSLFD